MKKIALLIMLMSLILPAFATTYIPNYGNVTGKGASGKVTGLRLIAPWGTEATNGFSTTYCQTSRRYVYNSYPCSQIIMQYGNYAPYSGGSAGDVPNTENIRIKAAIEYPAGTILPCTFNQGSNYALLKPGAQICTDPLGISIPAGNFWVRTYVEAAGTDGIYSITVTGAPTGGTFTLTVNGTATSALNYNCAPLDIQNAIAAVTGVGAGNVVVGGAVQPGTYNYVYWINGLAGQASPTLALGTNSLTGGTTPSVTIATVTAGANSTGSIPTTAPVYNVNDGGLVTGQDLCYSGTIANTTGYLYAPLAVLGTSGALNSKVIVGIGDSIATGVNDTASSSAPAGVLTSGYISRGLNGLSPIPPYLICAQSGRTLAEEANITASGTFRHPSLYGYATHAIVELGVNDLGASSTTLLNNLTLICQNLHAMGVKAYACTLTPDTTSTDGWITTANQTVQNTTNNTNRIAYNTALRNPANWATYNIDGIFDVADYAESARNSGLWAAPNGGTGTNAVGTLMTSSMTNSGGGGLHPSPYGYGILGTCITNNYYNVIQ